MLRYRLAGLLAVSLATLGLHPTSRADENEGLQIAELDRKSDVDYHKEILPLLRQNCLACHNATDAESDLVLESREAMLKGGTEGPAIVPGNGAESLLLQLAAHQREPIMPPDGNTAGARNLTSQELGLLKLWIDQGAKIEATTSSSAIAWRPLPATVTPILGLAADPRGNWVACGRGNRLMVYHLPSGRLVQELIDPAVSTGKAAHLDLVQSIAMQDNGTLIASGGFQTVKLWRRKHNGVTWDMPLGENTTCAALDASHSRLAIGTPSGEVRIVDLVNKSIAATISAHTGPVRSVAFAEEGQMLVTSGEDKQVCAWNLSDSTKQYQLQTPTPVNTLTVLDDLRVLTAHQDSKILLWALSKPAEGEHTALREFSGHSASVTCLALAPASTNQFYSGSEDGTVRLWDLDNGNQLRSFVHGTPVRQMACTSDGQRLATSGDAEGVKLWDATNGQMVAELKRSASQEQQLLAEQQQLALATAESNSAQNRIGELEKQITAQKEAITKAKEALDKSEVDRVEKQKLADEAIAAKSMAEKNVALADGLLAASDRLLQAAQAQQQTGQTARAALAEDLGMTKQQFAEPSTDELKAVAAMLGEADQLLQETRKQQDTSDAALIAKLNEVKQKAAPTIESAKKALEEATKKADEANKAAQDATKAKEEATINLQQAERDVVRSEETLSETAKTKEAWSAQAQTHEAAKKATEEVLNASPIAKAKLSIAPDGATLLVGDTHGRVEAFDGTTGSWITEIKVSSSPLSFVLSGTAPTGVAEAHCLSEEGHLYGFSVTPIWELERVLGGLDQAGPLQDRVLCLDFSRDGQLLAAGSGQPSRSGPIAVYNTDSGELVRQWPEAHSDAVYGVRFSRDGQWIASSAADRMARVFRVENGEVARTLEGHTHHVLDVAWQANDELLATAGADNAIKVWDFRTGEQKRTITGINKEVTSIEFLGITNQTLSSSGDTNARMHDTGNGNTTRTFNNNGDFLYVTAATADGKRIATGGSQGKLRLFDGENGKLIWEK